MLPRDQHLDLVVGLQHHLREFLLKLVDQIDEVHGHGCSHCFDVPGVDLENPGADGQIPAGFADQTGNPKHSNHWLVRLVLAHQGIEEAGAPAPKGEKSISWDDGETHPLRTGEGRRLQPGLPTFRRGPS